MHVRCTIRGHKRSALGSESIKLGIYEQCNVAFDWLSIGIELKAIKGRVNVRRSSRVVPFLQESARTESTKAVVVIDEVVDGYTFREDFGT